MRLRTHGLPLRLMVLCTLLLAPLLSTLQRVPSVAHASGVAYGAGDVFVGVGNGLIQHYSSTGTLLDTLNTTDSSSEDTGMCFDSAGNLRSTQFEATNMSLFDNQGDLVQHQWGSGFNQDPESCVVDNSGNIYVGPL